MLKMVDDKKYAQISNESIQAWAETVGIMDLSTDILRTIGADVTYRLHQILSTCNKYLSHSCRRKLTSDDFNRALKLMDVSPINGHSGSEVVEWVSVADLGVFVTHDPPVNLASTALSGDIFHQPGNTYVKGNWGHVSSHVMFENESNSEEKSLASLPLTSQLIQYYRKLFYVTTNPSVKLFEMMCEDLGTSPNIGPLIGPIIRSVLKGAQKANQRPIILRRLLLILRALLFNPHIHLGPQNYIQDIVNVLIFSVVTERKNPQDTHSIRTLAANILLKLSRMEGELATAWELAVSSLSGVIASSTRPWTQHAGALTGLIPLGIHALYRALMPIIAEYYLRLCQTLSNTPSATISSGILAKDTIDANMTYGLLMVSFVNMIVNLLKSLPEKQRLHFERETDLRPNKSTKREEAVKADLVKKIIEVYSMGEEMFGSSFVLQIPTLYLFSGSTPASFEISRYPRREGLYEETFLSEYTASKLKTTTSVRVLQPKERQTMLVSQTFENYRPIISLEKRKIYMCIRGCSTRKFEFLRHKKSALPIIKHHRYRHLLNSHGKPRLIGRMPHWTFIRPLLPPERPCSSINFLML